MARYKLSDNKPESKTLEELHESYITNCRLRGLAPASITSYNDFFKYQVATRITYLHELDKAWCEKYVLEQMDNGFSPNAINSYICRLNAFTNWLYKNNYINNKITVSKLRADNVKMPYTQAELEVLLKKPDLKKCNFPEYRTWVLICFTLSTGLRRSSIANLKVSDVDFNSNLIYVQNTKSRKKQYIPLSLQLGEILHEYLRYHKVYETDVLFCNVEGTAMSMHWYSDSIRIYCVKRGLNHAGLHRLRNTFALNYLTNGGNVFKLQEILGHRNINVTRKYVAYDTRHIQEDFTELNPLDNMMKSKKKLKLEK